MTYTELQPMLISLDRVDKLRVMQQLAAELVIEEPKVAPFDLGQPGDPADQALAFYEKELRPLLEPVHDGESVAIHVDTKAYEVAKGPGHAYRALRAKQPLGSIVVHRIGIFVGSMQPDGTPAGTVRVRSSTVARNNSLIL